MKPMVQHIERFGSQVGVESFRTKGDARRSDL
jgi:hypothetical protein